MKRLIFTFLTLGFLAYGCKPDVEESEPKTKDDIHLKLDYNFDGNALIGDSMIYRSEAGYIMSVSRLQYYISNIKLVNANNDTLRYSDIYYCDYKVAANNDLIIKDVPYGNYKSISFLIGLDSIHNISNALPNNNDNNNMAWPDAMGGGYHFLKLEGNFDDTTGQYGYAMHLGLKHSLVHCQPVNISTQHSNASTSIKLSMNVAEWFKNPNTYDFNIDGNYSMGKMASMKKLAENGANVFKK